MKIARAQRIHRLIAAGFLASGMALSFVSSVTAQTAAVNPRGACFDRAGCAQAEGDFEESVAECGSGKGYCYASPPPANLAISIGSRSQVVDIGDYVATVYNYGVGVAGLIAGVMFVVGGFQYLTAGGDASRATKGKERITGALIGLALALSSYVILNTVNPSAVALKLPKVPLIRRQEFVGCANTQYEVRCGEEYGIKRKPGVPEDAVGEEAFMVTAANDGSSLAQCVGKSCGKVQFPDSEYRCVDTGRSGTVKDGFPVPPYNCVGCQLKAGDSCFPDGANDQCCTGFCGKGKCVTGEIGDDCDSAASCKSGLCQTRAGNSCTAGLVEHPCNDDDECRGGNVCIEITGVHVCRPPQVGGQCVPNDNDCPAGSQCLEGEGGVGQFFCAPPGVNKVETCMNSRCPNGGYCMKSGSVCTTRQLGSRCDGDNDCATAACAGDGFLSTGICTDGTTGSRCYDDGDCLNKKCFESGDFGSCTSGKPLSGCNDDSDCASKKCDKANNRCN